MMNYLLFITPLLTIDWGSINWETIGLIFTIGVPIISFLYFIGRKILKSSGKQEKRRIESLLMHPHEVKPTDIMGDRGEIKYGYREDSWFERILETELKESVKSPNCYVTVITGQYASGKSRLVHHFLTSEDCQFKWVYAPKTDESDANETILKTLQSRFFKANNTLLVLDDIDNLYGGNTQNDLGLEDLMRLIHQKKIHTIVTVTMGTYRFDDFKRNCGTSLYKGRDGSQCAINFLEIQEIKKNDDCYNWCIAELKDDGFSTVIGGYVPELSRDIPESIHSLSNDEKRTLATYYVSTKYRRNEGKKKTQLWALHNQMWQNAQQDEHRFNAILGHLAKIGFLKTDFSRPDYYHIANERLYDAFIARCPITDDCIEHPLAYYITRTADAERNQIDCYLNIEDDERETRYSRVISHCLFDSNIEYIWEKMETEFSLQTKKATDALYLPIGDIIRRKSDGFQVAKKLINNGIIKPNETIIANLLRRTQDRKSIKEYINQVLPPIRIDNVETIFYLRCVEMASSIFDATRVQRAYQLYQDNLDAEYNADNYISYCECLLTKAATSPRRITEFWGNVTGAWEIRLLLREQSLPNKYIAVAGANNNKHGTKDPLIRHAYQQLCDHWSHLTFDFDDNNTLNDILLKVTQSAINNCSLLATACQIYDRFTLMAEHVDEEKKTMLRNRVSYNVFNKIKPDDNDGKVRARQILLERLEEEGFTDGYHKMINTYLGRMNSFTMIQEEIAEISKGSEWEGDIIDRDTINVMLKVLSESIEKLDLDEQQVEDDIDAIIKMHEDKKFIPTAYFNTSIYSCAQELIKKHARPELIAKVRSFAQRDIHNRDVINFEERVNFDISERARISSIIDINEANALILTCDRIVGTNKAFLHPDIIANFIHMYFNSFSDNETLKNYVNNLITWFDNHVQIPNPSYCQQKLRYRIAVTIPPMTVKQITADIESNLQQLVKMGYSLNDKKQDLYKAAIWDDNVSLDLALALLKNVAKIRPDQDSDSSAYDRYTYYFKANLITVFFQKLKKIAQNSSVDENKIQYYIDEIQTLINKHPHLIYIEDAGIISAIISRDLGISGLSINFPITSINASVRHEIWDNYASKQELYKLDEKTINRFIEQENKGKQSETYPYGDYYIKRAQEELDSRKSIVEKPVDNSLDNSEIEESQGEKE